MKFGTSLSLRRQVEDEITLIEGVSGTVAKKAIELTKEKENVKKRGRKKKVNKE